MRINLRCPFAEKDQAKALGARWDAVRKTWYVEGMEDLTPFMRWIGAPKPEYTGTISLEHYQRERYTNCHALSKADAEAFGVPWPLQAGWYRLYKDCHALVSEVGRKPVKSRSRSDVKPGSGSSTTKTTEDIHQVKTTGGKFSPLCNCNVLPWEDCEHTPAYLAMRDACVKAALQSA